jgi:hypothetical protein
VQFSVMFLALFVNIIDPFRVLEAKR